MFHLQRILFPVDFSERSLGAGRYVRALAERFNAELVLLHVVEPSTYDNSVIDKVAVRKMELQLFLAGELRPYRVERMVLEGDPSRKIVESANSANIDLIMMPTHGWGVYRRFILGSVTAKVLHDAACPVWTCGHAEQAPAQTRLDCRKILCAVDLNSGNGRVLGWARDLAAALTADLEVAHICQTVELGGATFGDQDVVQFLIDKARKGITRLCGEIGLEAAIHVEAGEVATTLQRIVRENKADLVVIGRSSDNAVLGRLRSNAYSIIRQSPCPVISV